MVEFALLLPMLIVLLLGIADFGRAFTSGITAEAAARNAAEAVAQEYLRTGPGTPPRPLTKAPPGLSDADYNGSTYYRALHDVAARAACREVRLLPDATYTPDNPATTGIDEETCRSTDEGAERTMPVIMTCVHDAVDPYCGDIAYGAPLHPECTELADEPDAQEYYEYEEPVPETRQVWRRVVEVRVCYRFTTLFDLSELDLPFGWGLSLGDIWLQRSNIFAIGYYPPVPAPAPPPPPPPPPPEPCSPPDASFDASPTTGSSPLEVEFTNTSTAVDCVIEAWSWDFGDGTTSPLQGPPRHSFSYTGLDPTHDFTVTLTASTPAGSDTHSVVITVGDETPCQVPTAAFTATPTTGLTPLTVTFTDDSIENECPIESWNWDFGDGTSPVTDQHASHQYVLPGTYTVTLTVTSAATGDDSETAEIHVEPSP